MAVISSVRTLFEAHLAVASLDASIAFYWDRLGLELAHVAPTRQAAFYWIGGRGKTMLGLCRRAALRRGRSHILRSRQQLTT